MQVTGIILSGGKSSRMGTDKALLKVANKTLLQIVFELCQSACSDVIVSSDNPEHKKTGYRIVADEIKNCGPIGGIYSCLKQSKTEWNLVISVDSPFVTPEFIRFLISKAGDCDAVIPFHQKGKEPLIALYRKSCLPEIEKMLGAGNYKMHFLLGKLNAKLVDVQNQVVKNSDLFRNLNQLEDF